MQDLNQSKHWVDKVTDGILAWQEKKGVVKLHVDDMKTPSGRVHVGSLVGVILHDVVAKVLQEKTDQPVTSTYVFNDMDPMDGLPGYLDEKQYQQYMGKPLFQIPAPPLEKSGIDFSNSTDEEKTKFENASSMAEFYAYDFINAFRKLGCSQEIVWSHQIHENGDMNDAIRTALDKVDELRKIYKEVADYDLPTNWYPFQVICENCGLVGNTLVTGWDGEIVTYECQPKKVEWSHGCGHTGQISPFGANGKLLWKVDWPAHWATLGITIEGAGKDHTTAGGSRDMANAICEQVFKIPVPFDIPYEWILVRGAKMSSSKGIGTSAREFVDLFPAQIGRFLFVNKHYNQVIDFDPSTMAIPDLFDEYDRAARIYWKKDDGDQRLARSFELAQINETPPAAHFLPRFRDVALWMQHPELDIQEEFAKVKGSELTELEQEVLAERIEYARKWVAKYAPEEYQLTPTNQVPEQVDQLTAEQKSFLGDLDKLIASDSSWQPEDLQQAIYQLAKDSIGSKQGFQAIYLAFIGKTSGPKAAWFLLDMDKSFIHQRIKSAVEQNNAHKQSFHVEESREVSDDVRENIPGMFFAYTTISGVSINKNDSQLSALLEDVVEKISLKSRDDINNLHPIQEYRKLFKATGTDFHKRRPSPEALMRRIVDGKGIYRINNAVDAYNAAVLETNIGLGGFDADKLSTPIVLRFSEEGEEMHLLGDEEPTKTRKGQLIYADQLKPITIDLNYRDIESTKITTETTKIMLFADGAPGLSEAEVLEALKKGAEYIQRYCGGDIGKYYLNN